MNNQNIYSKWFRWGMFNLAIVALYGFVMRYKIAFDFPYFDQKNLLHAHSHFAFNGWLSHFFYCGLMYLASSWADFNKQKIYQWLIRLNLLSAYGMLISFTIQGYKAFSIFFSSMAIVIAILFCIRFITDASKIKTKISYMAWAKTGLLLNVLSALGPLALAYIIISKNFHADFYLGSVYYFLHFQYNGWFFFGAMALAVHLPPSGIINTNKYYKIFSLTVIPTYGLSLLWANPPLWIYIIVVAAALIQLVCWFQFVYKLFIFRKTIAASGYVGIHAVFFVYAAVLALSIKFFLQALSVIPSLSHLVFGFRPIVIAYLHLIFLGVYSLFIFFYAIRQGWITMNRLSRIALSVFLIGAFLNEFFLGIQGVASFSYTLVPNINELLVVAAAILFLGALLLNISQIKKSKASIQS